MKKIAMFLVFAICMLSFGVSIKSQDKDITKFEITNIVLTPGHMTLNTIKGGKDVVYKIDLRNAKVSSEGKDKEFNQETADRINGAVEFVASFAVQSVSWYNSEEPSKEEPKKEDTRKSVSIER